MIKEDLLKQALKLATTDSTRDAELYASHNKELLIMLEGSKIRSARYNDDSGFGVRIYKNKSMGYAYTQSLDLRQIKSTIEMAKAMAAAADQDRFFLSLPARQKSPAVKGLYDHQLSKLSMWDAIGIITKLIKAAKGVSKESVVTGALIAILDQNEWIINSRGINHNSLINSIQIYAQVNVIKSKQNIGSGYQWQFSRTLNELDPAQVGKTAAQNAIRSLNPVKSKTRRVKLLLSPNATYDFLKNIADCLNGHLICHKQSCFTGKLNEKLAPEFFDVYDDALIHFGFESSEVDAEGVPRRRFAIFEEGILKNYLHTSYTANRLKLLNTSSAVRDFYKSTPRAKPSNLQMTKGTRISRDIIKGIDNGILIDSFPAIHAASGNISSMIDFGFEISRGEIKKAVKGTMIGANIFDLLKNIREVSSDARIEAGFILPYILIDDVQISS